MGALWDYVTGKSAAEGAALDAKRQAMNVDQRALYGEDWYLQTVRNDAKDAADVEAANQSIADEFKASALITNLQESSSSAASGVRSFLGPILEFPLKLIPWQGWLLLAGFAFFYLGGGVWLRRVVSSRLR